MHLRAARFRAIETRRPLLRATNSGLTVQVDPLGEIHQLVPPQTAGVGHTRLLGLRGWVVPTLAMHLGDWGQAAVFLVVLGLAWLARPAAARALTASPHK
jgi:apolipoprotein N-acyltransferase